MHTLSADLRCPQCDAEMVLSNSTRTAPIGTRCGIHHCYLVADGAVEFGDLTGLLGEVIADKYLVFDTIGQGGMGAVYRAYDLKLRREVALKIIQPTDDSDDMVQLRGRFAFEGQSLSRLSHRNVVTVFDYGERNGLLYLVLELVNGKSLSSMMRATSELGLSFTVNVICQLLDALTELHHNGIVHRDIKPSNLMIEGKDNELRVVLIDFGVAKAKNPITGDFRRELTRTGMAVGTVRYMSPEVLQDKQLGPWSDLYAVGVLLYHMLAGSPPFIGTTADVITAHLRDPVPSLPNALDLRIADPIIKRAMAKDIEDRYASAAEFQADLRRLADEAEVMNRRAETLVQGQRSSDRIPKTDAPASAISEGVPVTGSTTTGESKFNLAITEPHRFGNEFYAAQSSTRKKRAKSLDPWLVFIAVLMLGALLFVFRETEPTQNLEPEPAMVRSDIKKSTDRDAASSTLNRIVLPKQTRDRSTERDAASSTLNRIVIPEQTRDRSTKRPTREINLPAKSKTETPIRRTRKKPKRSPVRKRPPVQRKRQKSDPKLKSIGSVKTQVSSPKTVAVEAKAPVTQRKSEASRLSEVFNSQLKRCDCEGSQVTMMRMVELVPKTEREARLRWNSECGVMGEGCLR